MFFRYYSFNCVSSCTREMIKLWLDLDQTFRVGRLWAHFEQSRPGEEPPKGVNCGHITLVILFDFERTNLALNTSRDGKVLLAVHYVPKPRDWHHGVIFRLNTCS